MQKLETLLKARLNNARLIAILGVGSTLRGDDGAGITIAEKLQGKLKNKKLQPPVKILLGETAPENLTGEIKKIAPSHLIIIDSANIGEKPGSIALLNHKDVGGFTFCTHMLPIKVMVEYLLQSFSCEIIIIGIQPESFDYERGLTGEVKKSVNQISRVLEKILTASYPAK
jgi:hydrogenase 3 maturation protease